VYEIAGYGVGVETVGRWWNGSWGRLGRRDIWLSTDGRRWEVRFRDGGADGREGEFAFADEVQARGFVQRQIETAPGQWKDLTAALRAERDRRPR
jgi:hypothetical protein